MYMKGGLMYSFLSATTPNFRSKLSVVAPPVQKKTQGEILKERIEEKAKEAKKKDASERTIDDYVNIGTKTINKILDCAPVVYANEPSKLNYLA